VGFIGERVRGSLDRIARDRASRGQAILESVLVIPLMIVTVLGILQLTQIEQARIMTEFAAFSAARAGIVWNGSNARMRDAALVALLPTFGRTDSAEALMLTWQRQRAADEEFTTLPWGTPLPATINGSPLNGLVRVDTIAPEGSDELGRIWNLRGAHDWKEIDFDAAYTYPEAPGLEQHFETFDHPGTQDEGQEIHRRANLLSIRVRHWYELRVPLANWFLFVCWYASHARAENQRGFPTAYRSEMALLWALSTGQASLGSVGRRRFFIPLSATYSMRMQSNFYRKWLMHDRGG
jgi:hypothetical protein